MATSVADVRYRWYMGVEARLLVLMTRHCSRLDSDGLQRKCDVAQSKARSSAAFFDSLWASPLDSSLFAFSRKSTRSYGASTPGR